MKTRIFIASSNEGKEYAEEIARILKELGAEPTLWWSPKSFPPGSPLIQSLEKIARSVDAAVIISTDNDKTYTRGIKTTNNNVMLEYGLFAGVKGHEKAAIVAIGEHSLPTDLDGIKLIKAANDEIENVSLQLKPGIKEWLKNVQETARGSRNQHLADIINRCEGNIEVSIKARENTEFPRISQMTYPESFAHGWLLKTFSPFIGLEKRIHVALAGHAQNIEKRGTATILLGLYSDNQDISNLLKFDMPCIEAKQTKEPYYYRIFYKGETFETDFDDEDTPIRDKSILLYLKEKHVYVFTGTSPFGVAGAVSMLLEPTEGEDTAQIADRLEDYFGSQNVTDTKESSVEESPGFIAVGEVNIHSETNWKFNKVIRFESLPSC